MVETWNEVAKYVFWQEDKRVDFDTPIEVRKLVFHYWYPPKKEKVFIKSLYTTGCNFTRDLELHVVDIDGNGIGQFTLDVGIFDIAERLREFPDYYKIVHNLY